MREALGWLREHLLGDDRLVRPDAVRICVTGERVGDGWRALESWPPPGTGERRLWLAAGGRLRRAPRPATPTPAPTATATTPPTRRRRSAGRCCSRAARSSTTRPLEARADVLTYTTAPLAQAVEAIGVARVAAARARERAALRRLRARLRRRPRRRVAQRLRRAGAGRAGAASSRPPTAPGASRFDLWPMGHRFAAGHRIRLQVSSGAHPRYARNPGTGEDPMTATELQAVDVELLHGAAAPVARSCCRRLGA